MKANELRQKNVDELQKEYMELLRERFNLRLQQASKQLARTHQHQQVRRNIARLLTILQEKRK